MGSWLRRALLIALVAGGGYYAYDYYRAGFLTRPDMPDGAFSLSYKNGLRAILINVPDERSTRRYFGFPMEVPFYLKDAWSFCSPPSEDEQDHVSAFMKERDWPGARFEAVCKIDVGDEIIVRGVVTSVPKL